MSVYPQWGPHQSSAEKDPPWGSPKNDAQQDAQKDPRGAGGHGAAQGSTVPELSELESHGLDQLAEDDAKKYPLNSQLCPTVE